MGAHVPRSTTTLSTAAARHPPLRRRRDSGSARGKDSVAPPQREQSAHHIFVFRSRGSLSHTVAPVPPIIRTYAPIPARPQSI